jgi:sec-independent protein translocase protein TatA
MFGFGIQELLLVLLLLVLIFGASRIPELGRGLGEGIRNFKRGIKSGGEDEKKP